MRWVFPFVIAAVIASVAGCKNPSQPAPAQVFHEDFDRAALDSTVWLAELGDGAVNVNGGSVQLTCSGSTFPVVTTKQDPFPAGNFRIRVRLRYPSVAICGDGFGALDNFWELYHGQNVCRPFLTWQDGGGWYSYTGSSTSQSNGPAPNTDYHVYEWTYVNGTYTFFLDGVTISSGSCAPRPTRVFFGHPHPVTCGPWPSLEIDYIHIEPLA